MLGPLDEAFGHQIVASRATVEHASPAWAERCYHLVHATPEVTLSTGRAWHPMLRTRTAFVGVTRGRTQLTLRTAADDVPAVDGDLPTVGPIRIEVIEPLREVRLVLDAPGSPLSYDLTYHYRFDPVLTERNRIERDGVVVTDYINFFASGRYRGVVTVDGSDIAVDANGFRDRGWGLRKHEGAPRRGLVLAMFAEFGAEALYCLLYETASGRRVFSNAWRLRAGVEAQRGTDLRHDLDIVDGLLEAGRLTARFGDEDLEASFVVNNRVFLSPLGYAPGDPPGRTGVLERFEHDAPDARAILPGQTDHGVTVRVGDLVGNGYVESGLGVHARYAPDGGTWLSPASR